MDIWHLEKYVEKCPTFLFVIIITNLRIIRQTIVIWFQLTLADVFLLALSDQIGFMHGSDWVENYPNLKKVINNAANVPSIKVWLANRPKTP